MSELKILTWNVCFGCVTSNTKEISNLDKTAKALSQHCQIQYESTNTNVCLNNITEFITKDDYDIIGLQEASNHINLIDNILEKKNYLSFIHSKERGENGYFADILTFYNSNKLKIEYVINGNLSEKDARPYQILFFNEINTSNKIIIINLHYLYKNKDLFKGNYDETFSGYSKDYLINKLREKMNYANDLLDDDKKNYLNLDENNKLKDIREYILENEFYTILLGDLNDHDLSRYWENLDFSTLFHKDIILSSNIQPPNSCCIGRNVISKKGYSQKFSEEQFNKYGDYILIDNKRLYFKKNNSIPEGLDLDATSYPTSDHLPVTATVGFIQNGGSNNIYYKKYIKYKIKYLELKNKKN